VFNVSGAQRFPVFVALHVLLSGAVEAVFVWKFGHSPRAIAAHMTVVAEWDLTALAVARAVGIVSPGGKAWQRRALPVILGLTCTLQVYLYSLNLVSNAGWGRNMTARLVVAFAPTVWSGREPFPVGQAGIIIFLCGAFALMMLPFAKWGRSFDESVRPPSHGRFDGVREIASVIAVAALLYSTVAWGIARPNNLLWTHELVTSFFRPIGYAFEPTARRQAVAERDAALRATYPRHVATAHRRNVIVIIVDSLRADHMQVYGYQRATTPFLSGLVQRGSMKKVEAAFSTCSESFCGITSTLASREFRDISVHTFQLQDVLRDQGYQTWFLLSGNHTSWNGLTSFYGTSAATLFDGTHTRRYTMDDDRLVLEGLEQVPTASRDQPAFFYFHLMSTHYLGVQFASSHFYTRADDQVSPGPEPYKILKELNKPDRYDDKVRQADGVIREIFDALAAKHYLDDAVVVVTGDHGEGLGERHWAHGWNLYNEDIRIPLLLYDASEVTYPDLTFAAQVDIAPTILDRLALPIPASWEGQSLLRRAPTRFTYHQTYFFPNRFAVLYRDEHALFKFITTPEYKAEELYDLSADRGEVRNLVTERPALAALLRDKMRAYRAE
jgi:glucan phosphoethanolaminetransferase (alkaline phosphatase superfamily)